LNTNILYNEDCLNIINSIDNNTIDLIISDSPSNGLVNDKWDNQWKTEDEYIDWYISIIKEYERILKDNGTVYIYQWIGKRNPLTMAKLLLEISKHTNLIFQNIITWRKDRGFGVDNNYMYVREEILFYTKSNNYTFNVQYGNIKRNYIRKGGKSYYKRVGNVWIEINNDSFPVQNIFDDINEQTYEKIYNDRQIEYSLDTKAKSFHSTSKPIQLSERLIKASSNKNDIVLIPFAGSGGEIISCINLNRNYIGIEINKDYCEEIIKLINKPKLFDF